MTNSWFFFFFLELMYIIVTHCTTTWPFQSLSLFIFANSVVLHWPVQRGASARPPHVLRLHNTQWFVFKQSCLLISVTCELTYTVLNCMLKGELVNSLPCLLAKFSTDSCKCCNLQLHRKVTLVIVQQCILNSMVVPTRCICSVFTVMLHNSS